MRVLCDAGDLTTAINAVVPHNGAQKDLAKRTRIRLVVDLDTMHLGVAGASPMTAAVAVVPVVEVDVPEDMLPLGGLLDVDVTPKCLRLVGSVFEGLETIETIGVEFYMSRTPSGGDVATAEVSDVQATDVSAMFAGRTVRVPALPRWGFFDGEERVDAVAQVLQACGRPVSAEGRFTLPQPAMSVWARTARALGGLPLVAVDGDRVVVAAGALTGDTTGMGFLACGSAIGTGEASTGLPAYDGPVVSLLESWRLDDAQDEDWLAEGGGALVTELSAWLHEDEPEDTGEEARS